MQDRIDLAAAVAAMGQNLCQIEDLQAEVERLSDTLRDVGGAALYAAILARDVVGDAPAKVFAAWPEDIRARLMWTGYQDSFDRMPAEIQDAARSDVLADEWVVKARSIHPVSD